MFISIQNLIKLKSSSFMQTCRFLNPETLNSISFWSFPINDFPTLLRNCLLSKKSGTPASDSYFLPSIFSATLHFYYVLYFHSTFHSKTLDFDLNFDHLTFIIISISIIIIIIIIIIVIILYDVYYVFKLTVFLEINLIKLNEYKTKKYDDLCRELINKRVKLELFFVKISCVDFTSNNLKSFSNLIKTRGINVNQWVSKCTQVACRTIYYIFNRRGKSWTVNDILTFV